MPVLADAVRGRERNAGNMLKRIELHDESLHHDETFHKPGVISCYASGCHKS